MTLTHTPVERQTGIETDTERQRDRKTDKDVCQGYAQTHADTKANIPTCARAHTHTHTHTRTHTHVPTPAYTHIYTHARARTHTHTRYTGSAKDIEDKRKTGQKSQQRQTQFVYGRLLQWRAGDNYAHRLSHSPG